MKRTGSLARRLRFAAPLVMVTASACGQAAPGTIPIDPPTGGSNTTAELEADPVPDAGTLDLPEDREPPLARPPSLGVITLVVPAYSEQAGGYGSCHSFGKNVGCNPPRPSHYSQEQRTVDIRQVAADPSGARVTVDMPGGDDARHLVRQLVAGRGLTVHTDPDTNTRGRVIRVDAHDLELVVGVAPDVIVKGGEIIVELEDSRARSDETPTTPVRASVIDISADARGTIIVLNAGHKQGVAKAWRARLVDARRRPVKGGDGLVVWVTIQTSAVVVKLTLDQVKQNPRVEISPR